MSYCDLTDDMLGFLAEAWDCFERQPDRQYYLDVQNDHINMILLREDPCNTRTTGSINRYVLFSGSTLALYIREDVLRNIKDKMFPKKEAKVK